MFVRSALKSVVPPDVFALSPSKDATVDIRLRIDEREPPVGEVMAEDRQPSPFSGWLDLLRVLSETLEDPRGFGDRRGLDTSG